RRREACYDIGCRIYDRFMEVIFVSHGGRSVFKFNLMAIQVFPAWSYQLTSIDRVAGLAGVFSSNLFTAISRDFATSLLGSFGFFCGQCLLLFFIILFQRGQVNIVGANFLLGSILTFLERTDIGNDGPTVLNGYLLGIRGHITYAIRY